MTLLQGLEHPMGMDWMPNGDILVTERSVRLRLVRGNRGAYNPINGVPEVFDSGNRFSRWHGDVFAGGLKSQDIRRIDLDDAGHVISQFSLRSVQRTRDVRQEPNELLYVITDKSNGSFICL
ncbi:MAG: PQQ-dependent sugar dehydrogenase [Desulfobacterales bacterium]